MPEQFIAEGSSSVFINGQPAARSGDRSTCDAKIGSVEGLISADVRIGGDPVVVREIRSGKSTGRRLGDCRAACATRQCERLLEQIASAWPAARWRAGPWRMEPASSPRHSTARSTVRPTPVDSPTRARILGAEEELDFVLPGLLPIDWQRFYSSLDQRHEGLSAPAGALPMRSPSRSIKMNTSPTSTNRGAA